MDEAIKKAGALIEALQYIQTFKGETFVIKVGGSIMDDPEALESLLVDVCFLDAVGVHPVLVHGGGKGITKAMQEAGLEAQFVQGRRYTDERTLAIAEHVLVNDINNGMVKHIQNAGRKAMGLHSLASCVLFGKRMFLKSDDGRKIDIGYVGEVEKVNAALLDAIAKSGHIPVIAPIARDPSGGKLNINADTAAGKIAAALKAEKLVLVSDTHGIRTGETDDTLASHLTKAEIEQLIEEGVIASGMLPKVDSAFCALEAGTRKVHVIDGRLPHALLLEIFSKEGVGTEIVID